MNKITLTDTGKKILTGTVGQPGIETQYWVGYFGLAYVPESASDDLSGYTTLVGPEENGDYIYNIWQGDLTGNGHTGSSSDFTRLTQYDANLSTNFRYAYDEAKGCNRLITWTTAGSSVVGEAVKYDSYDRIGYAVYEGASAQQDSSVTDTATTTYTVSGIPVPAPLLYLGDNLTYSSGSLSDMADSLGTDWPMTDGGYPMVTPDMRCYSGASVDGASGDEVIASGEARKEDYLEDNHMANYKCFVSLSNYNKGHAQVSSEGYETDYQESCHNMSRVTKLFPIAQYEIADADPETKETRQGNANSIKYRLALDFGTDNRAYRDVLNFEDSDESEVTVFEENPNNSFKFNRIGIYAVPVSIRKFRKEGDSGCNHCQVEVDPDENPELVAIISLDEVMLSEDGSKGFTRWAQDFILNLQQVDPEEVPGCVRDVEVYYNMVENEAITWYQNQLLASAGLSEAVTTLGVDVAYLKSMAARPCSDCFTSQGGDDGDKYASIYHTHDYIKNLVDADAEGSVRGITTDATDGYGKCSFTMGDHSKTIGEYSVSIGNSVVNGGNNSLLIGNGSSIAEASNNAVMIGSGNQPVASTAKFDMENVLILGNGVVNSDTIADGTTLQNVSVLGQISGSILGSVGNTTGGELATDSYSNAHIFLDSSYTSPELLGIFPNPTDTPRSEGGYHEPYGQYIPIDETRFSSPDADGEYSSLGDLDAWAAGKTRAQIRTLVNKPATPMIYTGGIGLADSKIKLGSSIHSCAYIIEYPAVDWLDDAGRIKTPVIITGTTKCPFDGMLLGIGPDQDVDGTMRIALYAQPEKLPPHTAENEGNVLMVDSSNALMWGPGGSGRGLTEEFESSTINSSTPIPVIPEAGKRYAVGINTTIDIDSSINDGDEFIVLNRASYTIQFHNIGNDGAPSNGEMALSSISSMGVYLFRAASYIKTGSVYRGYIVTEIKSDFPNS